MIHGPRKSSCSTQELDFRIDEAKKLLQHIFHLPFQECFNVLLEQKETATYLLNNSQLLEDQLQLQQPTKEALLAFKDQLLIPDSDWPFVVETFKLKGEVTIHYLRQLRQEWDSELKPKKTVTGRGAELDLIHLLQWLLKKNPPKDSHAPIEIKFAFDGATITNGKRIQQEVGTLEILTNRTISEIKSPSNAVQWIIYLGTEDPEDLREELQNALPSLKHLHDTKKVN